MRMVVIDRAGHRRRPRKLRVSKAQLAEQIALLSKGGHSRQYTPRHNLHSLPESVQRTLLSRFPNCHLTFRWGKCYQVAFEAQFNLQDTLNQKMEEWGFSASHLNAHLPIIGLILPHEWKSNEEYLLKAVQGGRL